MWNTQKQQKMFSLMSNLQTYYRFKLDFQKVDQHTGGKWLNIKRWDNALMKIVSIVFQPFCGHMMIILNIDLCTHINTHMYII